MTFSARLKKDLCRQLLGEQKNLEAELAGLIAAIGVISRGKTEGPPDETEGLSPCLTISFKTENPTVAARIYRLIKGAFNYQAAVQIDRVRTFKKHRSYQVVIGDSKMAEQVLVSLKILKIHKKRRFFVNAIPFAYTKKNQRAYLRGVFLGCGSMANPEKAYHLELVGSKASFKEGRQEGRRGPDFQAFFQSLIKPLASFGIKANLIGRQATWVLYIKEGESLINFLNVIGAHKELLAMENIRIIKDMRNAVNRQVNCETANLNKTIVAATDQINDILYLKDHYGLTKLPKNLYAMAEVRLNYPDATIKELGAKFDPPVGKSGVYHRLSKLRAMAKDLRGY